MERRETYFERASAIWHKRNPDREPQPGDIELIAELLRESDRKIFVNDQNRFEYYHRKKS